MKKMTLFIVLIVVSLITITGCANTVINEGNEITVQKRVGETNDYEFFREVQNDEQVQNAKNILNKIDWENAIADMVHPPDYKFKFRGKGSNGFIYGLWTSTNKDFIELIIEGETKYIHLDKERSAKLFEIIVGDKLAEMK